MKKLTIIIAAMAMLFSAAQVNARKTGYKLTVEKESKAAKEEEQMSKGSFMVASQCTDCNNGYMLSQIAFTGYDKAQTSSTETFFITNNTDRTMTGITLYIEYLDGNGRQLHKRFVRLSCNIPAGETRRADIDSWDKQKSFHFEKSAASKRGGIAYNVIFDPVAFYLRF